MQTAKSVALGALLAVAVVGCEKSSSSSGKASGALTKDESSLFEYVPGSAHVVFGGDYSKFVKHWETSPLRKLSELTAKLTGDENGMRNYMTCWVEKAGDSRLAGSMSMAGGGMSMTMVFDGVTPAVFQECAKEANYTVKLDDDGKYAEVQGIPDGLGGTTNAGYYFPAADTAYFAIEMNMMGLPKPLGRAEAEARLAQTKTSSAANSPELQALMAKADRTKAFWFAGTAAGTPVADVLSGGHGWLELSADALSFGFSVDLKDPAMAKQAVDAYAQVKSQLGSLPPQFKKPVESILASSSLEASGNTLKGHFKLTNAVVEELMPALSMLGGGF